ncbi:MAG: class I SAM-dependent methyltransferase [Candidatus Krumholzibacteriia bacterium]
MTETYDGAYAQHADYFGRQASKLLRQYEQMVPADARVLDLGVGQGRNALPLAAHGCHVTGVDTSATAIAQAEARAREQRLEMDFWQGNFLDYQPELPFDAVLCFGLLQMLDRGSGASLVHRWFEWTRPGGVLFVTAWHVDDPEFPQILDSWERTGLHTFRSPEGENRLYLARDEILDLLLGWRVVHHWEGLGPEHRHGDGAPEQHGEVEAVAVRLG